MPLTAAFSVTKPADVQNGDLLVVIIGKQDDPAVAAPDGTRTLGDDGGTATGNDVYGAIFYKRITNAAGEPSSYTFDSAGTSESVGWWIGSLSDVSVSVPEDVDFDTGTGAWANLQNDTSPNAPAVTTATNGAMAFACWAVNSDITTTPPASPWNTRADNVGGNGVLTVCSQTFATAGTSTGTPEITDVANNQESEVGMFVFRPGGSSASPSASRCG